MKNKIVNGTSFSFLIESEAQSGSSANDVSDDRTEVTRDQNKCAFETNVIFVARHFACRSGSALPAGGVPYMSCDPFIVEFLSNHHSNELFLRACRGNIAWG